MTKKKFIARVKAPVDGQPVDLGKRTVSVPQDEYNELRRIKEDFTASQVRCREFIEKSHRSEDFAWAKYHRQSDLILKYNARSWVYRLFNKIT